MNSLSSMFIQMKAFAFCFLFLAIYSRNISAQGTGYADSIEIYVKNYVKKHGAVKGKDKKLIHFFPVDEKFRITCRFERKLNSPWFRMDASGPIKKNYRVFGTLHFKLSDTLLTLNVFQSQDLMQTEKYAEHLFIPFTDATSGEETYSGGRYIDLNIGDLKNDNYIIDFNKAYNPYCAYNTGQYSCPIPPKENNLPVAVKAGEKKFENHQ